MKQILSLTFIILFANSLIAQDSRITIEPNGTKIIKGFFTKHEIATDSAFLWYTENKKGYVPEPSALKAFLLNKDSINVIAFGGTWCGDTKNLLPKFFALTELAGFSQDRLTLIGVDRSKKTIHHLTEAFNITHVPTFIIMKNGKELGRVVEYGKSGMFDKELGEIITQK